MFEYYFIKQVTFKVVRSDHSLEKYGCKGVNSTLTVPMLLKQKDAKIFENHLNLVMLVFIG